MDYLKPYQSELNESFKKDIEMSSYFAMFQSNNGDQDKLQQWLISENDKEVEIARAFVKRYLWPVRRYTIGEDGLVNCHTDVILNEKRHAKGGRLLVKFGIVEGSFSCNYLSLTTLQGCPRKVTGNFNCNDNDLNDLKYGPLEVGRDYNARCCELTSLEGLAQNIGVDLLLTANKLKNLRGLDKVNFNGVLYCRNNELENLEGCPRVLKGIQANSNELTSLEGGPEVIEFMIVFNNKLKNLIGAPKVCPLFDFHGQRGKGRTQIPPKLIRLFKDPDLTGKKKCAQFLEHQEDFQIWNKKGDLIPDRFELLWKFIS